MPIGNRFLAAVLVLAGGAGLALMFHKSAPPVAEETAALVEEPVRRRAEDGPRFLREVRAAPPLASMAGEPAPPAKDPSRPMDLLTGLPLFQGGNSAAPPLARDYPALAEGAIEATSREPIEHAIVDGDTLSGLARRYLGEPGRAGEIFEANRDVLSDPELLPIGALLKIPAK